VRHSLIAQHAVHLPNSFSRVQGARTLDAGGQVPAARRQDHFLVGEANATGHGIVFRFFLVSAEIDELNVVVVDCYSRIVIGRWCHRRCRQLVGKKVLRRGYWVVVGRCRHRCQQMVDQKSLPPIYSGNCYCVVVSICRRVEPGHRVVVTGGSSTRSIDRVGITNAVA